MQSRLDHTFQAAESSPVWDYGLGLGNMVGALRPEFVDNSLDYKTATERLKQYFEYDEKILDNPIVSPKLFRSCQERHPGLCDSHSHASFIYEMAENLQKHLDHLKVDLPALCSMKFRLLSGGASSSDEKPLFFNTWYMLGCISKRPLCHIFAVLDRFNDSVNNSDGLAFQIDNHTQIFELCTSFSVLVAAVEQALAHKCVVEEMAFNFSVHEFEICTYTEHPNLVFPGSCLSDFWIGKDYPLPIQSRSQKQKEHVELPFGLETSVKPQKKRTLTRSKVIQEDELDMGGVISQKKSASTDRKKKQLASSDNTTADAEEDASAVLTAAQQHQLEIAIAAAKGVEEDEALIAEEKNAQQMKASRAGSKASFFHTRTGIISLQGAKRNMVCYFCTCQISKGTLRFEYVFSKSRPQRSIHTECVSQMKPKTDEIIDSLRWLKEKQFEKLGSLEASAVDQALKTLHDLNSVA